MRILLPLLLACAPLQADRWADAVVEVVYGEGAGFGQDFLPANVLGPPDPLASPTTPAAAEEELLSLGDGGWIVLAFLDNVIHDQPGPDLRVCENVFRVGGNPDNLWQEPAELALSEDGEAWQIMPWDSLARTGLAGLQPVDGSADPGSVEMGGDLFDLADVGLQEARFLRLRDLNGDGLSFDLDAVGGLRDTPVTSIRTMDRSAPELSLGPNPLRGSLRFESPVPLKRVVLYNLLGRRVRGLEGESTTGRIPTADLARGTYLLLAEWPEGSRQVRRLTLVR